MINIFICGDIVISSDRDKILSCELEKLISSADISICNFEGPIESKGKSIPKAGHHVKQLKGAVKKLSDIGFNIFSLANNHIYDYGDNGLKATIKELRKNNGEYIGSDIDFKNAYTPLVKKIKGTKVGFWHFVKPNLVA